MRFRIALSGLLSLTLLLASTAQAAPSPAPSSNSPQRIRLVWKGLDEDNYEIQGARDPRFTQELCKANFRYGAYPIPLDRLPSYARIRAVHDGEPVSEWIPLRTAQWTAPKLPHPIRFKANGPSQRVVRWPAPSGLSKDALLTYRVRLFSPSGTVLLDSLVQGERITLPALSQGAYEMQAETLGDATAGSLYVDGTSATAVPVLID